MNNSTIFVLACFTVALQAGFIVESDGPNLNPHEKRNHTSFYLKRENGDKAALHVYHNTDGSQNALVYFLEANEAGGHKPIQCENVLEFQKLVF